MHRYVLVSGLFLLLLACAQILRLVLRWRVTVAGLEIPLWFSAIAALIVFRFGLVSLACAIFTVDLLANLPFSADFSAWYIGTSMFALIGVVALAAWGFYNSLGGEPLWKADL